jgi:hypothetical protein
MAKETILDELRNYLEGVENYWLALAIIIFFFIIMSVLTLFGVYLYTRH